MYSRTTIIGNLGDDPKLKYTAQGQPVAEFSVAVNRKGKDGENVATWYAVTAWAKLGETCAKHLAKGRLVLVEGEIGCWAWADRGGEAKAKLTLTARDVRFLSGKEHAEQMALGGDDEGEIPF